MHEVQTNLQNAADLDDDALLEAVVHGWEVVCQENASQRHLVSEAQFEQWVSFRNQTSLKMHEIIDFSDGPISESDRSYLESIANMIASATHKTEGEIIVEAENAARREREDLAEKERQENETETYSEVTAEVTAEVKKQGILSRLKALFTLSKGE